MKGPASAFHRGGFMFSRRGVSTVALTALACSMLWLTGCGGGDDGDEGPQRPEPTTPTPPSSINPCTAALAQETGGDARISATSPIDRAKAEGYGSDDRDVREPLWEHYLRAGSATAGVADARPAASQDIGEIAVLEDDGTLFLRQNAFDLRNLALRFERNGAGGYDITSHRSRVPSDHRLAPDADRRRCVAADAAVRVFVLRQQQANVFVNSDGNLTFEDADTASSTRGFARLLGGPPRIAPFFADLDPSAGGTRVRGRLVGRVHRSPGAACAASNRRAR